tara:strand:+ start:1055 stop:1228 length:174 start_codon:yes stop_codon:yes gene_type:complete
MNIIELRKIEDHLEKLILELEQNPTENKDLIRFFNNKYQELRWKASVEKRKKIFNLN